MMVVEQKTAHPVEPYEEPTQLNWSRLNLNRLKSSQKVVEVQRSLTKH